MVNIYRKFIFFSFVLLFLLGGVSASLGDTINDFKNRPCKLENYASVDTTTILTKFNISSNADDCFIILDKLPFSQRTSDINTVGFSNRLYGVIYESTGGSWGDYLFILGNTTSAVSDLVSKVVSFKNYPDIFLQDFVFFAGPSQSLVIEPSTSCNNEKMVVDAFVPSEINGSVSSCFNSSMLIYPVCSDYEVGYQSITCEFGCSNGACLRSASSTTTLTIPPSGGSGGSSGGGGGGSGSSGGGAGITGNVNTTIGNVSSGQINQSDGSLDLNDGGEVSVESTELNWFGRFINWLKGLFS